MQKISKNSTRHVGKLGETKLENSQSTVKKEQVGMGAGKES